ncbi:uncharacterized protein LOC113361519 [Papaver somniferum]|uniref:uncharacterized protein LOC113361519 n=1 Tax=Papaver somniferum TaxID=3469 RepID=UPI000E6F524E|nr:uncharacterized protein LOC113361519 [Papaver somniferum]
MDIAPLNYWNPIEKQVLPISIEEQVMALPTFHEFDILKTQSSAKKTFHEFDILKTQGSAKKTQSSAKKRKTRDTVLDFMEGFRQRNKNNVAREPSQERNVSEVEKSNSEELLDCNVAYANVDIAEELCRIRKASEDKVAYANVDIAEELCRIRKASEVKEVYADNRSERRFQVYHCLTGFPKKKRSVPADDTASSTGHQHKVDQNKLEINVAKSVPADDTTSSTGHQHRVDLNKLEINVAELMSYKEDEKQVHQKQQKQKRKYQKKEISKVKKIGEKGEKKKSFPPAAPPQEVPQIISNSISALGGTTPVWLNEKLVSKSDILRQQARFFLPSSTALLEFLTPAERQKCLVLKGSSNENNQRKKNELIVTVVDPEGETSEMKFKNWGSLNKYVLSGANWNNLVAKFNMVARKTKLHLWCFRKTDSNKLCFAIDMITED